MPLDGDHCNGSVDLEDAESVMGEIVSPIPVGLRRIPAGETWDQAKWALFQLRKFPQLRWLVPARPQPGSLAGLPWIRAPSSASRCCCTVRPGRRGTA